MIDAFEHEYAFLSNFYPADIEIVGKTYPTVEHAYQAAKAIEPSDRELIRLAATPGRAKRIGQTVTKRPDWKEVKLFVMRALLKQKFRDHDLALQLLQTGDQELVEGNTWGDRFWGRVEGEGENHLGKLLMQIRTDLKHDQTLDEGV